ncbi:MAG: hypothetical protein EA425_01045 [Puniceicoccaceae bacterium]|nr:MAG: hypothetical protein EA425_01045 [Puniceicoccaceae bacterium]
MTTASPRPRISQIAALGRRRIIGSNGALPWSIPEDWSYFLDTIRGHPVVMGRKTYQCLEEKLPVPWQGVITRSPGFTAPDAEVFATPEQALEAARARASDEIFILGGGEIYARTLDLSDRLYLTLIDADYPGDTVFPDWSGFGAITSRRAGRTHRPPLEFLVVDRTA